MDFHVMYIRGMKSVSLACVNDDYDKIVKKVSKYGNDILNEKDSNQQYPIQYACRYSSEKVINYILQNTNIDLVEKLFQNICECLCKNCFIVGDEIRNNIDICRYDYDDIFATKICGNTDLIIDICKQLPQMAKHIFSLYPYEKMANDFSVIMRSSNDKKTNEACKYILNNSDFYDIIAKNIDVVITHALINDLHEHYPVLQGYGKFSLFDENKISTYSMNIFKMNKYYIDQKFVTQYFINDVCNIFIHFGSFFGYHIYFALIDICITHNNGEFNDIVNDVLNYIYNKYHDECHPHKQHYFAKVVELTVLFFDCANHFNCDYQIILNKCKTIDWWKDCHFLYAYDDHIKYIQNTIEKTQKD
jgi:hypothetical protein